MKSKRKFFRRALSVVLSLVMLVSIMAVAPVTVGAASSYTMPLNTSLLQQVGAQDHGGVACSCYALAYCRTILDGSVHSYSEYNRYGATEYNVDCIWSNGNYYICNAGSAKAALKACYDQVNLNRPVILHVYSSNGGHYVTVVGYQNVSDPNNMSASNLLIIDPWNGISGGVVACKYSVNSSYQYIKTDSGGSTPHTHSYTTESYQWYDHPHYQCYSCSCGDIQVNTSEPEFQPEANTSCSHCKWSVGSGIYATITNRATGKALTSETDNNVDFQTNTESLDQIWYLTRNDDGSYYIQSMRNGWYLDLYNGITSNKTNVWTYAGNQTDAQKWFFSRAYNDDSVLTYSIISKLGDSLAIEMAGGGTSDGTNAQVFRWNLTDAQIFMVNQISVSSFELNESDVSLEKGETSTLSYSLNPSSLSDLVTWSSSDTDVATVDNNGEVKAVGVGTATITAKLADGSSTQCTVTVKEKSSITLSSTELTLKAGESKQLTATVTPSSYSGSVTWTSNNTDVATVDSNGKVTAVGVGTAKITASVDGKTATCAVTVDPAEVYFESNEVTLMVGDGISQDLLYDSDEDTGISYSSKPTWKSSDTDVATVNEWGNVVAVSTGTAVITATAKSGVSASFTVNVVEESDVYIDYYTDFVLSGYNELYLMDYETGNVYEGDVTWKSSNESVATVEKIEDAQGYANVTALSAGTVTITATTDDGKSVSRTVSIIDDIHGGIANVTVTKLPTKEFTEAIEKDWITTDDYGMPYIDYTSTGEDFSTAAKEREIAQNMAGAEILITFKDGTTQSYTFTDESDGPFSYSYTYGYPSIVMDNGYKLEVEVKDLGDYEAEITCMRGTCYCTTTFNVKNAIDDTQGDDDVDTDTDDVLKGDVNDDGDVNMKDLTRLHQYINGWNVNVNLYVIDVNGDGDVNMKDLTRLHQYINGWDVKICINGIYVG